MKSEWNKYEKAAGPIRNRAMWECVIYLRRNTNGSGILGWKKPRDKYCAET